MSRKLATLALVLTGLAVAPLAADDAAVVRQVGEAVYDWRLDESLWLRRLHGLPIEKLPALTPEKANADASFATAQLKRLEGVDATKLAEDDRISLEILRFDLEGVVEGPRHRLDLFDILPYSSPISEWRQVFGAWSFPDAAAAAAYTSLLAQIPDRLSEITAKLHEQAAAGIRVPRPELDQVVPMMRSYAAEPSESPWVPAAERLAALPESERNAAIARITAEVRDRIGPAFAALADWLDGDYRKLAPETVGLAQYPGGLDTYRWLIRRHTSLDLTPEQIHAIGLAAIDDVRKEMEELRRDVGFSGTLDEFRASLRNDPRFYAKTPEEVRTRLLAALELVEPAAQRFFAVRPKAPYTVRRLAPQLEGGQTFGYYDPPSPAEPVGIYYFNGSKLDQRSLLSAVDLMAHELVPGHHFQVSRTLENETLSPYRRDFFDSAAAEGWAEYAADVAGEAGAYADPYDRMGRLTMISMLGSRLVVDTGMNALGWSRQRAIDFLLVHTNLSATQAGSETLRYACDIPAHALAYRLGHDTFHALRDRAAHELGEKFDLRRFHEAVLAYGAMPMSVLDGHIDRWIAEEKAR